MDRVLVTGCSSGIGRTLAVELTERGYDVVATGRVDVLLNTAGVGIVGPIEMVPRDAVRAMFETNVFGAARMIQAVVPGMRQRGRGTVVNVTALAGRVPGSLNGSCAASNHAPRRSPGRCTSRRAASGSGCSSSSPGIVPSGFEANRRTFGVDQPPRDARHRTWEAGRSRWEAMLRMASRGLSGPEMAAAAIADALESSERRLRLPIGADAELIVATRDSMDTESFEDTVRAKLGIDW